MSKNIILFTITAILSLSSCSSPSNSSSMNDSLSIKENSSEENTSSEIHTHNFDQQVISDIYLNSAASCKKPATYFYSCICGEKGTNVFEHGNKLEHNYEHYHRDSNCIIPGIDSYKCTLCGEVKTETELNINNDSRIDYKHYARVDYIESTGTQYIDTGFSTVEGMITRFDCVWTGGSGGYMVGSHSPTSPYGRNGGYLDIGRSFWELGFGETYPNTNQYLDVVNKVVNVSFSTVSNNAYLIVDGQTLIESKLNEKTSSENVLLFYNDYAKASNSPTTMGKLYETSIWDHNNNLVRHFIPVIELSSSTPGMYDAVNRKFYKSETDAFLYGEILYHNFIDTHVVNEPTYFNEGLEESTCEKCGIKLYNKLPRLSYQVNFNNGEHSKIYIYDSQDYKNEPKESNVAYSKNVDLDEYSKVDGQVNFKVSIDDGYILNDIKINGEYKNLKKVENDIYRITKIATDLTVDIDVGINLTLSKDSGFYNEPFELSMNSCKGVIYYTLDGSEPNENSLVYSNPILINDASNNPNTNSMLKTTSAGFLEDKINLLGNNSNTYPYYIPGYKSPDTLIDKCTVIRAIAIDGETRSKEITGTYFVGFDKKSGYEDTGVISLIVNNDDFFGYENGIYVMGKTYDTHDSNLEWYAPYWWWWWSNYSNSGDSSERKVKAYFFDEDKEMILEKIVGTRIHGNGSRGYIEKSLNFYARDEYDNENYFNYNFFDNDYLPQRLTLTSGGDDYTTKLYDYLMSAVSNDALYDVSHMKRYCLFINGEFWGYYYLSDKQDEEYFEYYYEIDKDNLIMVKDGSVEEGDPSDIAYYNEMVSYISSNDMSIESNYNHASELIDIDSYIDYYASMAYIGRTGDWPGGNTALYRSKEKGKGRQEDCKWRYIMFDINSGAYKEPEKDWVSYISSNNAVFRHLYRNEQFKKAFDNRLVQLAESRFLPKSINSLLDQFVLETREQMIKEYERFFGSGNTKIDDTYDATISEVRSFFDNRYTYIIDNYKSEEHIHSYTPLVIKEATFFDDGLIRYTCECKDTYDEIIPKLKYEDYAYKLDFICDEHIKVFIYNGQDYESDPTSSLLAYSTDKKGNLLKDGEGQINFLIVVDDNYTYEINVSGSFKNIKGKDETGLDNVYRITKIKSDLTINITTTTKEKQ